MAFLAQDGVVGKTLCQYSTNRLIRGQVRVSYRGPIALRIGRRRFFVIEFPHDGARRERRRNGAIQIALMARMFPNQSVDPSLDSSR